jgi:flagellar basal-body rod modification protein FlgD
MEITSAGASTAAAPTQNAFAALDSSEFIKVMVSELTNQDPFNPQDTSVLLEQMSSLRNIESQLSLQEQLQELVLQNQMASAGNLIGKLVQGLTDDANNITGMVTSVRITDDQVYLELDTGQSMRMSQVSVVAEGPTAGSGS